MIVLSNESDIIIRDNVINVTQFGSCCLYRHREVEDRKLRGGLNRPPRRLAPAPLRGSYPGPRCR